MCKYMNKGLYVLKIYIKLLHKTIVYIYRERERGGGERERERERERETFFLLLGLL